jgi:hypothetical protein
MTDGEQAVLKTSSTPSRRPPPRPPRPPGRRPRGGRSDHAGGPERPAQAADGASVDGAVEQGVQRIRAEEARVAEIRRLCQAADAPVTQDDAGNDVSLEAFAVAQGWDLPRTQHAIRLATELRELRQGRPEVSGVGPGLIVRGGPTLQAIQGAMILRAGGRLDHRSYTSPRAVAMKLPAWLRAGLNSDQRQRVMEEAHRFAGYSFKDVARLACQLDGKPVHVDDTELFQAAVSGTSLTQIFTTNVNAVLIATYDEFPDTSAAWTQETDVADFKTQDEIRLKKGGSLTKHARGQTADHNTREDELENYSIGRFSGQFVVDEMDMIDDNMQRLPGHAGRDGQRRRPSAARPGVRGPGEQPDAQRDGPPALQRDRRQPADDVGTVRHHAEGRDHVDGRQARQRRQPQHPRDALRRPDRARVDHPRAPPVGADRRRRPDRRRPRRQEHPAEPAVAGAGGPPRQRRHDPDTDTAYAGSTSTWFLASTQGRTIKVAFRRGTGRAPRVRPYVLTQGQWGMGWDISHDIGAAAMDFRFLNKATA